jgi:CDP-glucose 4,6-dehydratase
MAFDWKGKTAFVTGGAGFVGANLVSRLLKEGSTVVLLERDRTTPNSLDVLRLRDQVTVITGSVDDLDLMERVLNEYQPQYVFHLAAQALVNAANRSPISTFEANIRGTYMLLEACRRAEPHPTVVVASSDKAYGSHKTLPYSEDFPLQGVFPYDVSKSCTDMIARSYALTYGMPVSVTRSANIYGPGDVNLSRVIPGTIVSVLRGERPIIRSDGTPIREFIYVDDVVDGPPPPPPPPDATKGEQFNFGSDEPVQILDLVNRIIEAAGLSGELEPDILLTTKIEREIDAQYLSGEKMRVKLGWSPKTSLDAGLERTFTWYRDNSGVFRY